MAEKIVMPKLAMAMKEGKVVEWMLKEGEQVEKGQVVMVIETEKVSYEVEAPVTGLLHIIADLDQIIPVTETVAFLAENEDELKELQASQPVAITTGEENGNAAAPKEPAAEAVVARPSSTPATMPSAAPVAALNKRGKVKISPLARKIANNHSLDITRVVGTGPGGIIKKRDVLKALETGLPPIGPVSGEPVFGEPVFIGEVVDGKRVKATLPFRGMRQAIAKNMVNSLSISAQVTGIGEMDMTRVVELRKSLLQQEEQIGVRISYTDILIYVLARAIKAVPQVNASLVGNEVKIWEDINVGIAVALQSSEYETGLIVPVLKNADKKSLTEISRSVKDLTSRARNGELTPDDLSGGTVTLSNTGTFMKGWFVSTPIINQPEALMVQPAGIFDKPLVIDGKIVIRPVMTISTTFDHRVTDGAPVGHFITLFKEYIENPDLLFL